MWRQQHAWNALSAVVDGGTAASHPRPSRSDVSGKREELSELAWHGELPRKEIAHSRDRDVEN